MANVPAHWLPPEDDRLEQPGGDLEPFSKEEMVADARREIRHYVAVELLGPAEATLRQTGPVMTEFQELADQLSSESELAIAGLRAASVVLIMTPAVGRGMFGHASPELLARLARLVDAAADGDFGAYVGDLPRRTRGHVRDFFMALSDAGSGIALIVAPPSGEPTERTLPLEKVREGLRTLRETTTLPSDRHVFVGYLEGINHKRRTFSVREAPVDPNRKGRSYAGRFDPEVDIEGVSSGLTIRYRFTLIQEAEVTEYDTEDVRYRNVITGMELLTDQLEDDR